MIAYLQGKDVTVEVPDDIGDKDLSDLNQHFDTLVKPETPDAPNQSQVVPSSPTGATSQPENASPTWTPNFYESFIKPILPALPGIPALALQAGETPERRAFTGKAAEEFTFGATKPIADPMLSEDYKQHPVYANLGAMAGGVGSLLATGGALKAAGLAEKAAQVGAEAADTFAAAPRFLPRAIMTGATFGTQTFVKETVKAFQEGNVDLAAFGGHVLKNTALGATLGAISGLSNVPVSVLSAGGLGFVSSKMDGGDNAEATLNGGIWAIFEAVGSYGRTAELRSEALKTLGDSIGEYVQNKDPNIAPEQAKAAGEAIVRQAAERVGGIDAVVKGEKGETLQLIEDINQQVRQGKIQEPVEAQKLLEGPAATEEPAKPGEIGAPAAPVPQGRAEPGMLPESAADFEAKALSPFANDQAESDQANSEKSSPQFSIAPGAKAEEAPVIKQVTDHFKESATEIRDIIAPGKAAPLAERITRENLGKMARSYDVAEAALEDAHKLFDSQPNEVNLAFIDKMEHGQKQDDPQLEVIAKTLRTLLDSKRQEIQSLGTGKLKAFIENYFPHIWDQGEKGVSQAIQKAAKRPLEGGKAFLKKRKIEFTNDGIEMGLTPVSFNPVELTLLKIREMDKYLMAHRTIKEFKDTGLAQYVKVGGEVPEGWTKIDDKVSTVFKSPMVAVKEAYDEEMMNRLNAVAKSLGIDIDRQVKIDRHKGLPANLWGVSQSEPGKPGKVTTKFGGPESVVAHEIGHQIDDMYGLQDKFLTEEHAAEFERLAKEYETKDAPKSFQKYVRKPPEQMAHMLEAYIHAPELFKQVAPTVAAKFEAFLKSKPELTPLTEIKPSLVLGTNESEVYAGGAVIAGHIWAQPDAARIINNYLSPGLQKYATYRAYRAAGNFLNQAQLGFSFFHLGFTSLDAVISKNALALMELMNGNTQKAILDVIRSPLAPIENIIRGDKLLQAWRGKGQSPVDEILAEAMATAGGRARMDQFYQTRAIERMIDNFKKFNLVRGALNIPMALTELTTRPILEYVVPRQKLGVFSDLMRMEIENRPEMTHDEMRAIAQRIWDSVDNRMGQMVYDNLFWNRVTKDLAMASVRSVGWNLGTIREIGGGIMDTAEFVRELMSRPGSVKISTLPKGLEQPNSSAPHRTAKFTYKMSYLVMITTIVGALGAIIQYLRTGKGPEEPKDYYFPKTGGLDRNGDPARMALPSYMKDIYAYKKHPFQTVLNKTSPLLNMLVEMYQNKDYYGTKIRNEDDPLIRQMMSEAEFVGKQLLPFSLRGTQQNLSAGNRSLADVIGPWIGVTPAPASINQTPAEELAHEIASSHVEIGGRTKEQVDRSHFAGDLRRRLGAGDQSATQDLMKAMAERRISRGEAMDVFKTSRMTPLQRTVHSFSYDELQRVYKKANTEEKAQIEPLLRQREISNIRQFGDPAGRVALP